MSSPRKAVVLLPRAAPGDRAEKDAFAAQYLACQLYAANHDLAIVGCCETGLDLVAGLPDSSLPHDSLLTSVASADVGVVLTVNRDPTGGDEFADAVEQVRATEGVDVVFIDGRTTTQ